MNTLSTYAVSNSIEVRAQQIGLDCKYLIEIFSILLAMQGPPGFRFSHFREKSVVSTFIGFETLTMVTAVQIRGSG